MLEVLRADGFPLDIAEIATRVGLHPNTVRLHLDHLVDAGLATPTTGRAVTDRVASGSSTRLPAGDLRLSNGRAETEETRCRTLAEALVTHLEAPCPSRRLRPWLRAAPGVGAWRSRSPKLLGRCRRPPSISPGCSMTLALLRGLPDRARPSKCTDVRSVSSPASTPRWVCGGPPWAHAGSARRTRCTDAGQRAGAVRHPRAVLGPLRHRGTVEEVTRPQPPHHPPDWKDRTHGLRHR